MGLDGFAALRLCEGREVGRAGLLQRVLSENYVKTEGKLRALEPSGMDSGRVRTPHEPDALLGVRRGGPWTGDEAHLVETADAGLNLVVGTLVTDPRRNGYQAADFGLDFQGRVARCPAGHLSASWVTRADGTTSIRRAAQRCAACSHRSACTTCKQGRRLELTPDWERLHAGRLRAKTKEFREVYRHRAAMEATFSELVHRHGFRRSRYRGAPRRRLHAILAVTALNAKRMLRWIGEGGSEGAAARRSAACGA